MFWNPFYGFLLIFALEMQLESMVGCDKGKILEAYLDSSLWSSRFHFWRGFDGPSKTRRFMCSMFIPASGKRKKAELFSFLFLHWSKKGEVGWVKNSDSIYCNTNLHTYEISCMWTAAFTAICSFVGVVATCINFKYTLMWAKHV